jgi:glycosyltransferase involved in cell wall biosynthesis
VKFSLVIGSRNRATQLVATLSKLDMADLQLNAVEVNLIDSASTDSTYEVMREYSQKCGSPVNIGRADHPGTGLARNVGIKISSAEVIVFTDDDCYIDANYFSKLSLLWDGRSFQYGGGQIIMFDASADPRIANLMFGRRYGIRPNTVLPAGYIQGANMFFARKVFQRAGLFNEDMPGGSDIEMATRASLQGFRGVLLPELKVLHDHGRKRGSTEAERKVERYDFERGAYYASLILMGNRQAWELWAETTPSNDPARLAREMSGAQHYLELMTKKEKGGPE